jgi:hypothetical protein
MEQTNDPTNTRLRSLINNAAVRDFALSAFPVHRPALSGKITRVSRDFLLRAEAKMRDWVCAEVRGDPSRGKTLK